MVTKANPKGKDVKAVKAAKPVEKPTVDIQLPKEPKAEKPKAFEPLLGEKCELNGDIISITSFDPLTATVYKREDGVQTTHDYPITSLDGIKPIDKQDLYERLY